MNDENYIIKKTFNSYNIYFKSGVSFYDIPEEIIDVIIALEQKNQQQKEQLKQRNEVIDETIEFINHVQYDAELRSHVYGINFTGTMRLLEILQKYKGDNK